MLMETVHAPTDRQLELLVFMSRAHASSGKWPSQREMADALGVNSSNMSSYLRQVIDKGFVRKTNARHRNAALTDSGQALVNNQRKPQKPM